MTAGVTDTDGYDCGTYAAKFDITMKLTLEGIAHWEEIVHAVFEYLNMLKVNGCPEWVFDELAALADISFRFQEDESAVERCEELGETMQVRTMRCMNFIRYIPCSIVWLTLSLGTSQYSKSRRKISCATTFSRAPSRKNLLRTS